MNTKVLLYSKLVQVLSQVWNLGQVNKNFEVDQGVKNDNSRSYMSFSVRRATLKVLRITRRFRLDLTLTWCVYLTMLVNNANAQTNSVFANGEWYKLAITETGIYKVTGKELSSSGINISTFNPNKIRLFGHPGGMLPQANNAISFTDPIEMAIEVNDGADGSFNDQDYLLFFAEGSDYLKFEEAKGTFRYEQNYFTDTAFVFLNISNDLGKRVQTQNEIVGEYPVIDKYDYVEIHEVDIFNKINSGREWYGEEFNSNQSIYNFDLSIKSLSPNTNLKLVSSAMGASFQDSQFDVELNGNKLGAQMFTGKPEGTYSVQGYNRQDTFSISSNSLPFSSLSLQYSYTGGSSGYLNHFMVHAVCDLSYHNEQFMFRSEQSVINNTSKFIVKNELTSLQVWDISNFNTPFKIPLKVENDGLSFNAVSTNVKDYVAFNVDSDPKSIVSIKSIRNQNLHGDSGTDLLIVTHSLFEKVANELGEYKSGIGIRAKVVTTDKIFNEYSSGKMDITAIRNYVKHLYDKGGIKHLLLLGKGTFDYKNIKKQNNNFVPIYESRNSLHPLSTYGSDDFLGFMEDAEGEWIENTSGDHTLDIGVGRLPVQTLEDARNIKDKIIKYHSSDALGSWRKKIYYVAEDGDFNLHQRDAERLATMVDTTHNEFNVKKIYIDAYPIEFTGTGGKKKAPQVNEAIVEAIHNGALIINYTGHGREDQWANTNVFHNEMIDELKNTETFPLFVTATCEYGRHDKPTVISGAERLVFKRNAGAIGMISTSRPVFSSNNYTLNTAFYSAVLHRKNGKYPTLGEVFMETKNNSLRGSANRNFSLLGDPSLTLAYPKDIIEVDSIKDEVGQHIDTLRAMGYVILNGSIRTGVGQVDRDANGEIEVEVFEKHVKKETLGATAPKFTYNDRDNVIFRGKSTVVDGLFEASFYIPKDISYSYGVGKVSMYAINDDIDANGALDVIIGGTATIPKLDKEPPAINIYFGDTTYISGEVVRASTLMVAKLTDASGINISTNQIGHDITFSIDNSEPIKLNDYYEAEFNEFEQGWVRFPLNDLEVGSHTITFIAWDNLNNMGTLTMDFYVSEEGFKIETIDNYPNPFSESTNFDFTHNFTGQDITVELNILSRVGQMIHSKSWEINEAQTDVSGISWDGEMQSGAKLIPGLYLYSLTVRSVNTGGSAIRYGRLILEN